MMVEETIALHEKVNNNIFNYLPLLSNILSFITDNIFFDIQIAMNYLLYNNLKNEDNYNIIRKIKKSVIHSIFNVLQLNLESYKYKNLNLYNKYFYDILNYLLYESNRLNVLELFDNIKVSNTVLFKLSPSYFIRHIAYKVHGIFYNFYCNFNNISCEDISTEVALILLDIEENFEIAIISYKPLNIAEGIEVALIPNDIDKYIIDDMTSYLPLQLEIIEEYIPETSITYLKFISLCYYNNYSIVMNKKIHLRIIKDENDRYYTTIYINDMKCNANNCICNNSDIMYKI